MATTQTTTEYEQHIKAMYAEGMRIKVIAEAEAMPVEDVIAIVRGPQPTTDYLIILSTKDGEEADRKMSAAPSLEQAIEDANYAADCLIESYGLYCAWTVYECSTGRKMASWLPEGYTRLNAI